MWPKPLDPRSLVGIDAGSHSVKVLEARASGWGCFSVQGMAEVLCPPAAYHEGEIASAEALGAAIRTGLTKAGITTRQAVLAVPPQAGSKWVAALMAAACCAGVTPVRIDMEPLALYRAASALKQVTDVGTALVDLGWHVAKISLFEGDAPAIIRVVDLPCPQAEAVGSSFAGPRAQELFWEIRRSLEFALTRSKAEVNRVLITGGTGGDRYLAYSLSTYLRSCLVGRLPPDFEVIPLQDPSGAVPASHMVALGLSLTPQVLPRSLSTC